MGNYSIFIIFSGLSKEQFFSHIDHSVSPNQSVPEQQQYQQQDYDNNVLEQTVRSVTLYIYS